MKSGKTVSPGHTCVEYECNVKIYNRSITNTAIRLALPLAIYSVILITFSLFLCMIVGVGFIIIDYQAIEIPNSQSNCQIVDNGDEVPSFVSHSRLLFYNGFNCSLPLKISLSVVMELILVECRKRKTIVITAANLTNENRNTNKHKEPMGPQSKRKTNSLKRRKT